MAEAIFEPLEFRNLTVKNRVFRSNIAGRFDDYDGTGTQTRINWELKFARGGVGAIVSSWCGVDRARDHRSGLRIDRVRRAHPVLARARRARARARLPLHPPARARGRQRDIPGVEFEQGLSSTDKSDPLHGFQCRADDASRRSEAMRARSPRGRGGRARPAWTASRSTAPTATCSRSSSPRRSTTATTSTAARSRTAPASCSRPCGRSASEVGDDFHLQVKLATTEYANALLPWAKKGNTIEDSVEVAAGSRQAGADAIHVSSGSTFPHPDNPAGAFSAKDVVATYDVMLSSGIHTFRNYLLFRTWPFSRILERRGGPERGRDRGGEPLPTRRRSSRPSSIPVLVHRRLPARLD